MEVALLKKVPPTIVTCVGFKEFSGDGVSREEFRGWVSRFSRSSVLYAVGVIGGLLETWENKPNWESHNQLVRDAFLPEHSDKLLRLCGDDKRPRLVFHRPQILVVAKEGLLSCPEHGIDPFRTKHWGGLGLAFLMASDLLYPELEPPKDGEHLSFQTLFRMIPSHEYSGRQIIPHRIARASLMMKYLLARPEAELLDIKQAFIRTNNISIEEYTALCAGIMSHYLSLDYVSLRKREVSILLQKSFFDPAIIQPERVSAFMSKVSADENSLKAAFDRRNSGTFEMTPFRNFPLVRQAGDRFFCIDTRFLADKLESGIFWSMLDSLPQKDRTTLHRLWGYSFEAYVNHVLQDAVSSTSSVFMASPVYERTGAQVCDGIIVAGTDAIVLEYKGHTFRAESKYSGDLSALENEINEHLVLKGVSQVAAAIEGLFSGESTYRIRGLDLSKIKRVFPVIVTRDDLGGSYLMSRYLNGKFKKIINRRSFRPIVICPLFSLSAEGVETLSPYLAYRTFGQILEGWYRNDPALFFSFLSVMNPIVNTLGLLQNELLQNEFEDVMNRAAKILFNKELAGDDALL